MEIRRRRFNNMFDVNEVVEQLEDQTYYLVPGHQYDLRSHFDKKSGYTELHKLAQDRFDRNYVTRECEVAKKHLTCLREVIPVDLCQMLMNEHANNPEALKEPQIMKSLLPLILNDNIDSQLCSYFNSEYNLLWYSYLDTPTFTDRERRSYSSYWHCDGGPARHLKMLIYLNPYEEHLGNTRFLDKPTTDKLKDTGYIFCDISLRTDDLGPLGRAKDIEIKPKMYDDIKAGDALLFNPNQLAHIGKVPELKNRHVLQLCFVPSPFHWEHAMEHIQPVQNHCVDFANGWAKNIMSQVEDRPRAYEDQVLIPSINGIQSRDQLRWLIQNMYKDQEQANKMYTQLIKSDPKLSQLNSINALMNVLKTSTRDSINWEGELGVNNIRNLAQLANYEAELQDSITRYSPKDKPSSQGIFWPMPDHPEHPGSKYDQLPFVQTHPIMNANTPIGSAGSCFAFEIARVFQEMGFNYVVTERNDDPNAGFGVDGYRAGDKYAKFCANYGILFNTPSFRQLAERAFGVTKTKQILFQQPDGGWVDPYRESVLFFNSDAYKKDYHKHIAATRAALEQVEVFIITLGLNECWSFRDGTVMSRNPRANMYPYVTHKTLTVEENIANIQAFFDIVKQHNPNFKLIISVSPIPFLATGRGETHHVITANTHSKSILRVSAEELVNNNEDMYYLPSYELVTECIKDAWDIDTRHVKKSTVEQVVDMFKQIFIKPEQDS